MQKASALIAASSSTEGFTDTTDHWSINSTSALCADPTSWHAEDTFEIWARRASIALSEEHGANPAEIRQLIDNLFPWCRPQIGEGFRHWHSRVQDWIARIDVTMDPRSPVLAIQGDERHEDWLARVALTCIPMDDSECPQDLIDVIAPVANSDPPRRLESALDWFERLRVRIELARSAEVGINGP